MLLAHQNLIMGSLTVKDLKLFSMMIFRLVISLYRFSRLPNPIFEVGDE